MGKQLESIDADLAAWLGEQHIFFVATAPLSAQGHINASPKGGDSFRVLGPQEVVYQDYTGSGAETAAHLRENGRILILFCAFRGAPKIVRLHGEGRLIVSGEPEYEQMVSLFPNNAGTRAFVRIRVTRVSSSCGYSVPQFDFREDRDTLDKWVARKGAEDLKAYRRLKNQKSIDNLPAFPSI